LSGILAAFWIDSLKVVDDYQSAAFAYLLTPSVGGDSQHVLSDPSLINKLQFRMRSLTWRIRSISSQS